MIFLLINGITAAGFIGKAYVNTARISTISETGDRVKKCAVILDGGDITIYSTDTCDSIIAGLKESKNVNN